MEKLLKEQILFLFITNNSKPTPLEVVRKLKELGIAVGQEHVYTSAMVTEPDFVVLGEGRNFTLDMVQKAVNMILDGVKLIATNRDPSPKLSGSNRDKLGIAATTAMIEEATGLKAFEIGKPGPVMRRAARKALGLQTAETTIIGDTMTTDIQGGVQMGCRTILALSGASKKEELWQYAFKPDMTLDSIADIALPLPWWDR